MFSHFLECYNKSTNERNMLGCPYKIYCGISDRGNKYNYQCLVLSITIGGQQTTVNSLELLTQCCTVHIITRTVTMLRISISIWCDELLAPSGNCLQYPPSWQQKHQTLSWNKIHVLCACITTERVCLRMAISVTCTELQKSIVSNNEV